MFHVAAKSSVERSGRKSLQHSEHMFKHHAKYTPCQIEFQKKTTTLFVTPRIFSMVHVFADIG